MNTPLAPRFAPLPLGTVRPRGWLQRQLRIQADGLSGHLDEIWPSVADSRWIGGGGDAWERGPYWLDGFVPLAFLTDDEQLQAKARRWVDYVLAHQHADGWLGPRDDAPDAKLDPWPQYVLFKALTQWQEATGDERVVPALLRAMRRIGTLIDEHPLESWAMMRWPDLVVSILWVHARTGESDLLDLAHRVAAQGYDWGGHFADFRYSAKQPRWLQENHVVNHAMALKEPAVRRLLDGETDARERALQAIAVLDRWHGQATGLFSGDESLAGRHPSQGTELCAVVEYLFSLELLTAAFGDPAFADRLERIAYNALPATFTPDMWAHQYDQQANQVVCCLAPDGERIYTNNAADANLFGLEPHFGCCAANMHQGWPKLVEHLWMRAPDGGLVSAAYGPSEVTAAVGETPVRVVEETDYPFRGQVRFRLDPQCPARFALWLRVPEWADGIRAEHRGMSHVFSGPGYHRLEKDWFPGDVVEVDVPMALRPETRDRGAVTVHRGPLVMALPVGESYRKLRGTEPYHDREVYPTTPWNYALDLAAGFDVREAPVADVPFSGDAPPVALATKARRVPGWGIESSAAAAPPLSPVVTGEPLEDVALVPYGCARLRVTELPVAGPRWRT